MKKSHFFGDFFGWDWETPAILRLNPNKITFLCGYGFLSQLVDGDGKKGKDSVNERFGVIFLCPFLKKKLNFSHCL